MEFMDWSRYGLFALLIEYDHGKYEQFCSAKSWK